MKAALLTVVPLVTDPRFVCRIFSKGFDFVFYLDCADGGGIVQETWVIRRNSGPTNLDKKFSSYLKNRFDEHGLCYFSTTQRDKNYLDELKAIFAENGVEVVEIDISRARKANDVDAILAVCEALKT